MAPARQWRTYALAWALTGALQVPAADFALTPAETARVAARQIVIRPSLDAAQRRGTVRAAVQIEAPADLVYRMLISCADALAYVPHLRSCRVRERGPDDSWLVVEHEIDFGWYAPRLKWVMRAELTQDRKSTFHQVSGDFRA